MGRLETSRRETGSTVPPSCFTTISVERQKTSPFGTHRRRSIAACRRYLTSAALSTKLPSDISSRRKCANCPCYVGAGQEQSRFCYSKQMTPPQARGLTRKLYPWRSSCCRGLPIDPECGPRLSHGGPHSGSFGFGSRAGPEPHAFDDKQPAIR
jgi:hypothetical protein